MARDGFDPVVVRSAYDAIVPEYAEKFGGDLDGLGSVQARSRDPLPHERQSGRIYLTATALP
jgi:hypothetical protein